MSSPSLPKEMKAIKCTTPGNAELKTVPVPSLKDDYILIKTTAVALNPTDWKHVHFLSQPNATVGCDYAGKVVAIGPKVTKKFSVGDRVAGFAHGVNSADPNDGAFAEYVLAKGDVQIKTPESLSDEEAATLGVGVSTVGQALYQSLGLPEPGKGDGKGEYVLIYGGSTATGSLAVQFAKLSGFKVITTNSPHNDSLMTSLGAEKTFDYSSPTVGKDIRSYTSDKLSYAMDCISAGPSAEICNEAISSKGGKITYLLPVQNHGRKDVEMKNTLAYTQVGEAFDFRGTEMPAKAEDFEFAKGFWEVARGLLADGKVKVHPPDVRSGGLQGVFGGLEDLKENRVSGKKLVYTL